jgi:hypothetical protein
VKEFIHPESIAKNTKQGVNRISEYESGVSF